MTRLRAYRRLLAEPLEPRTVLAAPYVSGDTFYSVQDQPLVIEAAALLANDRDDDGDQLYAAIALARGPYNGTLTIADDDTLVYQPRPGFYGFDRFYYYASDGTGFSLSPAEVEIDVRQPIFGGGVISRNLIVSDGGFAVLRCYVQTANTANDDCYGTDEDTPLTVAAPGVLANDFVDFADVVWLKVKDTPDNGTVSLAGDGGFTYSPAQDDYGSEEFVYEWMGTDGLVRSATVHVEIASVNDPPDLNDDLFQTESGTPLTILVSDLLANDRDVDHVSFSALLPLQAAPRHGSLAVADTSLIYTPELGYPGTDQFSYLATDGEDFSPRGATVLIEMTTPLRHNRLLPSDVNSDNAVAPVDALLIIDFINAYGSRPVADAGQFSRDQLDVTRDGFVTPADALAVISVLNARRPVKTSAAGASAANAAGTASDPQGQSATRDAHDDSWVQLFASANPPRSTRRGR